MTDAQQYEFYSKWYYTAVREIVDIYPVKDDFEEIAHLVSPPIKVAEAKRAIEFLAEIGFIRKNSQGFYEQTDRFITTGYEAKSVAITNFLMSTADLAKGAVDRYPRLERNMGAVTFVISDETYTIVQDRIRTFRREILEIVRADKSPNRVYHLNLHLFPMSRRVEKPGK
jgi:uncharacterized protein (TIGR02147 family)